MAITANADVIGAANSSGRYRSAMTMSEANDSNIPLLMTSSSFQSRVDDDDVDEYASLYDIDDGNRGCCQCQQKYCRQFCSVATDIFQYVDKSVRRINVKQSVRKRCTLDYVKRWFPIAGWLPKYRLPEFQGDLIAGVSVGMTVIPQAIAYASIAGLPAQYGLYSAFIGCFVYVIFGTACVVAVGPTAIMSLMTAEFALSPVKGDPTYAIILCLGTGIVQLIMAIFGLGVLMDFISFPVLKAFTSAAAITIAASQFKNWLGQEGIPKDFLGEVYWTFGKLGKARLYDFLLGLTCIIFIILFKKLRDIKWNNKYEDMSCCMKFIVKMFWIIATARNIIVIIAASSLAAVLYLKLRMKPFTLTGYIPPGIPPFTVPRFSLNTNTSNSSTNGRLYTFGDIASSINVGFIILPVIGLVESMSVAKAFARRCNYKIDPNQELLSFGISNILSSFVSAYPLSGTFSRTALNYNSGVKTTAGGIITGVIVLVALQFMTPLFFYIPKAALGVVIIMAVLDMITFHKVLVFWRTHKIDLIPWFITFVISLVLGLEYGIAIGVGLSLFFLVYPSTRPKLKVRMKSAAEALIEAHRALASSTDGQVMIVEPSNGLMYPTVDYIEQKITKAVRFMSKPKGVVLDFRHVAVIDMSVIQCIKHLYEDFVAQGITMVLCNIEPAVKKVLSKSSLPHYRQAASVYEALLIVYDVPLPLTAEQFSSGQIYNRSDVTSDGRSNGDVITFSQGDITAITVVPTNSTVNSSRSQQSTFKQL